MGQRAKGVGDAVATTVAPQAGDGAAVVVIIAATVSG